MTGIVTDAGTPIVQFEISGQIWDAIVDMGFNGDLELPEQLKSYFGGIPSGDLRSILAGGFETIDEMFTIQFPLDGETVLAEASYAPVEEILLGTGLLTDFLLKINFRERVVQLDRLG